MFASTNGHIESDAWLRLGRWLVAGLTFQLPADILETAITTSWDEVARLGAIAAIRTFLNFFLERDIREAARVPMNDEPAAPRPAADTMPRR
jgi:uncharacterized membrane protein